ncbi:DUF4132 domain-containing protein [Isobaculum melis]|uniref:DUF4132 domain-containing protein n=1 Tax=Isobaculum melis TaxID=142588 RepID=A0A1H9U6J6_9LACT|nr:DUF4132 domain-containing protein [Isobaculum melis]SES04848.1 protein of unknown function [Isobaculum melis]
MQTKEEYQKELQKKTAKLKGYAKQLATQYIKMEMDCFKDSYYLGDTVDEMFTLLESANVQQISELFSKGLFDLVKALVGKEDASVFQRYCENLGEYQYAVGSYRRSYHSEQPAKDHSYQLIALLFKLPQHFAHCEKIQEILLQSTAFEERGYGLRKYYQSKKTNEYVVNYNFFVAKLTDELTQKNPTYIAAVEALLFGENNTTVMSHGIIQGIVQSHNVEIREALGKLLLAAQRQEGLRQAILETADSGTIDSLIYFMHLIKEHDLLRFSSVQRAISTWTGLGYEVEDKKIIAKLLDITIEAFDHPEKIDVFLASEDSIENYGALWVIATKSYQNVVEKVREMLQKKKHQQLVALYFVMGLNQTKLQFELAEPLIMKSSDLDVLSFALSMVAPYQPMFRYNDHSESRYLKSYPYLQEVSEAFYNRIEEINHGLKEKEHIVSGKPFPWIQVALTKQYLYGISIIIAHGQKNQRWISELLKNADDMTPTNRNNLLALTANPPQNEASRSFLFDSLNDRSSANREYALSIIDKLDLQEEEALKVEDLFRFKSGAVRQSSLNILEKLSDTSVQQSLMRLLQDGKQEKRLGGLDLLLHLYQKQRVTTEEALEWVQYIKKPTEKEQSLINNIEQKKALQYTTGNGFGLYHPNYVTPNLPQLPTNVSGSCQKLTDFDDSKLLDKLTKLTALIEVHKEHEYVTTKWGWSDEKDVRLLGIGNFGVLYEHLQVDKEDRDISHYPLAEIWQKWAKDTAFTLQDYINYQLIKGMSTKDIEENARQNLGQYLEFEKIEKLAKKINDLPFQKIFTSILDLLPKVSEKKYRPFDAFYSAYVELLNAIPTKEWNRKVEINKRWGEPATYKDINPIYRILHFCNQYEETDEDFAKLVALRNELARRENEKEETDIAFYHMNLEDMLRAVKLDILPIDALYLSLFKSNGYYSIFDELMRKHDREKLLETYPIVNEVRKKVIDRILEIELKRGDTQTEVSHLAKKITDFEGIDDFVDLIYVLADEKLIRGYVWGSNYTKREIFSHLLKESHPPKGTTVEMLKTSLARYEISEKQLLNAMMYAPQWIDLVSQVIGWKGLKSTAWYFRAHTSDFATELDKDQIGLYSGIDNEDFREGAFDVKWFMESYQEIGKKHFEQLYESAKYTSDGSKHRRAQLYADAALGKLKLKPLSAEVADKRNKDKLRCIGIVPLNKKNPLKDAWNRYSYLQQFLKESKQFGAQRRASEGKATEIALENLARNIGDGDVIRFSWRMEIFNLKEIAAYFEPKALADSEVYLKVNEDGQAQLAVEKAGKTLKSVPAKLKKEPYILKLKELQKNLKEQYRRSKKSLEQAMEKGSTFTAEELKALLKHPVLCPLVEKLVMISEENQVGFMTSEGMRLVNQQMVDLPDTLLLRIAHPYDLYQSGEWRNMQHILFSEKIVQPFKQVFRELYLPNEDELGVKESKRYAGHQIQPQKTVALLKNRDWVVSYEDGLRKVYYEENIIATLYAMADWFSPADIEAPTIEGVLFYNRKDGKRLKLEDVPPVLFSEVMRDMDLVVSVAHVGGVDPEATHSTIETRGVIVEELIPLMKLENVRVKQQHVLIKGRLGEYTVHLGSGVVHQVGGSMIPILAVQSQHRGRIFLPFVDEDPRTAEIMSKVFLLSEDYKIKDPTILGNIQQS